MTNENNENNENPAPPRNDNEKVNDEKATNDEV
jgi:hypothetical protein